jgi:hypothetical protein
MTKKFSVIVWLTALVFLVLYDHTLARTLAVRSNPVGGGAKASLIVDVTAYGARCDGLTDDTDGIRAAVMAASLRPGGILRFSNTGSPCLSNSFTVPASVTTRLDDGSVLAINSGETATITGPIEANASRHFAGAGSVSFAGNKSLKEVYLNWWTLNNDGQSDDTANLQKIAVAMQSGMNLLWPAQTNLYVNGTVTFAHLKNFRMGGLNKAGDDTTNAAKITIGPAGTIIWDCVRKSTFENLYVLSTGNNYALQLDQLTSTGGGDLSSDNTIEGNNFTSTSNNTNYIALRIANGSSMNNEFHQILNNTFRGPTQTYGSRVGTGVYLGHSNIKNVVIETNIFVGLSKSINSDAGSFRAKNNRHASVDVCYYGAFSDAIYIIGDDSEGATQVLDAVGFGVVPVFVMGGRFNDMHGGATESLAQVSTTAPVFNVRNTLFLSIVNCQFAPGPGVTFGSNFIKDVTGDQMPLVWQNNYVHGISKENLLLGLKTFKSVNGNPYGGTSTDAANFIVYPSLDTVLSTGTQRPLIRLSNDTVQMGTGEISLLGLATPTNLTASQQGATGNTQRIFRLIAKDANGNHTPDSNESNVTNCNAALSAANYVLAAWTPVPGASGYDLIERDLATGQFRLVASPAVIQITGATNTGPIVITAAAHGLTSGDQVYINGIGGNTAANNWTTNPRWTVTVLTSNTFSLNSSNGNGVYTSGGMVNPVSYHVTTNPAGAVNYSLPGYNETGGVQANGPIIQGVLITFADGASAPSVARSNYFRTTNTSPTTITNFSQGRDGQLITVLLDANTRIANNNNIKTRSAANIAGAANITHSFLKLAGIWYQQN